MSEQAFEGWAIVELMGHRRLGGYVTEVEIAGAAMLRIDIPDGPLGDVPEELQNTRPTDVYATQFYSASALYCLTPTTERMARAIRSRPTPVQSWEIAPKQLAPAAVQQDIDDDLAEVFDHDDDDEDRPF